MDFHFSFFRALSMFQAGRRCRFFQWRDDEICEHDKVLIPQQRQRIIKLEAEFTNCKKREKFLVVVVALLVAIFAVLYLFRQGVEITCVGCCAWQCMQGCSVYVWRVAMFMYKGLVVCSILVGLVISNDTLAAYFVLFLLRNK